MDGISGKQGNGEAYGTVMSHGVAFGGRMRGIGTRAGHIEKTLRIRKGIEKKQLMNHAKFAWVLMIVLMYVDVM